MSTSSNSEYGENIVVNGDFDGNADGWILSGGMKYEGHHITAQSTGSYVKKATQTLPIEAEETYLVKFSKAVTGGSSMSSFYLGNVFVSFGETNGELSAVVTVTDVQPLIINVIVPVGAAHITNVSVQELLFQSSSSSSSSLSSLSSKTTSSLTWAYSTSSSVSSISSSTQIKSSSSSISSSSSSQTITSSSSQSSLSSISDVSSVSSISISSLSSVSSSSVSSSSLSSSSVSSLSSSTASTLSSRSSKTSSSSEIRSSSSSQSSLSSSSSSSSLEKGYFLVPFTFESTNGKQIWCFARNESYVYAGTGTYGKIIRSQDYYNWDDFETVEDSHVKSLFLWSNGLFIGTEPHGKIYVYNFSTSKFYNFVQTEDSCVSCFVEYNGNLYAGTSPLGVIYQFDGDNWKRVYRGDGNGIVSMNVYNGLLYVFLKNVEFAVIYDGSNWKIMPIRTIVDVVGELDESSSSVSSVSSSSLSSGAVVGETVGETVGTASVTTQENNKETFYSFRNNRYEPLLESNKFINRSTTKFINDETTLAYLSPADINLIKPTIGVKSILSSCSSGLLYMGSDNGIIFSYPDIEGNVKILHQEDNGKVSQIISVGVSKIIVAIDNKLYLIDDAEGTS